LRHFQSCYIHQDVFMVCCSSLRIIPTVMWGLCIYRWNVFLVTDDLVRQWPGHPPFISIVMLGCGQFRLLGLVYLAFFLAFICHERNNFQLIQLDLIVQRLFLMLKEWLWKHIIFEAWQAYVGRQTKYVSVNKHPLVSFLKWMNQV
jgi:hypothetical protein